jgi:hypothetical protein
MIQEAAKSQVRLYQLPFGDMRQNKEKSSLARQLLAALE